MINEQRRNKPNCNKNNNNNNDKNIEAEEFERVFFDKLNNTSELAYQRHSTLLMANFKPNSTTSLSYCPFITKVSCETLSISLNHTQSHRRVLYIQ